MKSFVTEQIKILQVCKSCQKYAEDIKLLLPASFIDLLETECSQCIDLKVKIF